MCLCLGYVDVQDMFGKGTIHVLEKEFYQVSTIPISL